MSVAALALVLSLFAASAAAQVAPPRTIGDSVFTIRFWPGHERVAADVLQAANALSDLPALPREAVTAGRAIRIDLAPNEEAFRALTGSPPEWGAGIAIPSQDRIVLPIYASRRGDIASMAMVLRHEIAHIALNRYLGPASIPRWFDEGYARWAAGEWDFDAPWMLRLSFALHRTPPLDSLELGWPGREADARVAYLLGMSVIQFLYERGGEPVLASFLRRWRQMGAIEPALLRTYGLTLATLEQHWSRDVRERYGWTYLLGNAVVFWAFAGVLVLLLFLRRRRRDRAKMEKLKQEELPENPAFWLGETEPPTEPPPPPPSTLTDEERED